MVLKHRIKKIPMDEEIKRQFEEQLKALGERFGITNLQLKNFGDAAKKGADAFKKSLDELNKEIKKGRAGYADQLRALEQLNDAIEDLAEQAQDSATKDKITQLQKQRAALMEQAARQNATEQLEYFGEELKKAAITGTGRFVRGLQDNASSVQLTSGILNAGIDMAAAALTAAGSAATGFGATMMNAKNPVVAGLGVFVSGLGYAGKVAAEAGAALAKFGVEVFGKELEKTVKAFNDISAGGALFTDGMTGMRNAARDSKLTLEDFAAVISRQSANLSTAGLSVPEAVKKMGGALRAGGDNMRNNLMNLGFRIEEHGDLVAETMAMMAQTGGPLRASNTEVAAQTQKYAENLRIISAITGEDAKTKMAAVQDQANQLAFQQKLAGMDETQRSNIIMAMGNMTDLQRKNFMETMVFGAVINEVGASAAALSSGLRDSTAEAVAAAQQGTLDADKMRQINSRNSDQMQKDFINQTAIGYAGAAKTGGLAQELAESMGISIRELQKMTPEAIAAAEKAAKEQKDTRDVLTTNMNLAAIAAKDLAIALQEVFTNLLPEASQVNAGILQSFKDSVRAAMGKGAASPPVPKSDYREPATSNTLLAPRRPNESEEQFKTRATELRSTQETLTKIGKAKGGISTGPVSGYSEILHGTEAVVPLPDGRSIPVSMDSSSITAAVNQQSGILAEILRAMQNNNSLTSQIAMNTV
jgi:hypothetical protein